jgi:hypothetical protein
MNGITRRGVLGGNLGLEGLLLGERERDRLLFHGVFLVAASSELTL